MTSFFGDTPDQRRAFLKGMERGLINGTALGLFVALVALLIKRWWFA